MDFLKRDAAPITDKAWSLLESEAARTLRAGLSARRVVRVDGPRGLDYSAVGLGRLDVPEQQPLPGVRYGVHRVQPLVELRAQFELDQWELDNVDRGAADIQLDPLYDAVKAVSAVEDRAVFQGFPEANIIGMSRGAKHASIEVGRDAARYADAFARGVLTLQESVALGPYVAVLGPKPFRVLEGVSGAYPPRKQIEQLIGGEIHLCPHLEGGFLIAPERDGLAITIGQDLALCYEAHDARRVRLSLVESFTFQVLDPTVYVPLSFKE